MYKSRKTNLNSPVSTAHNYPLTAVYWSVIMECQDWGAFNIVAARSSDVEKSYWTES
jgi:hypothetical protein